MVDLGNLVSRASARNRTSVAIIDGARSLTFGEVEDRSNRLANAFLGLDLSSGARVAVLMSNRAEFIETDLAILKAGLVKVPINPRLADGEREHILRDSEAELVVYEPEQTEFVSVARDTLPHLINSVSLGASEIDDLRYEELLQRASARRPALTRRPDDAPSFILYTSGTTGHPKGAVSSYAGRLAATVNMLTDELDVRRGDAMVHVGPLSHGSGSKVLAYYLRGARNIVLKKFDPEAFFEIVERDHATGSFMVPTMLNMLCAARDGAGARYDLSSLRTVSYGGAPIAPARLRDALEHFGPIFVQVYGSCEAPHPVTVMSKADHETFKDDDRRLSSLGREVTMVEVALLDEAGQEVPSGEPGELVITGANVMIGYWDNADATRQVFRGRSYRSGDAAIRDEDGLLYMVDRVRDLIISGGLNVYPAEVEAALEAHPAVAESAVIGVPDDTWGENVMAFVVLRPGASATIDELVDHCRTRLAGYKKPKGIAFVATLPRGSTGKILKRTLRDPYWAGRTRSV